MALVSWFVLPLPLSLFDDARLLELAILAWLSLLFLAVTDLRQALMDLIADLPPWIRVLVAVLAGLAGASALHSRFPVLAFQEISLNLLLVLFACGCAVIARVRRDFADRLFTWSLLTGAVFFLLFFAVAYHRTYSAGQPFPWVNPFVTFSNIRFFSQFQAYTLPLLVLPLLVFETPGWLRAGVWLTAGSWWALHFASGTRSLWLSFPVSALFLALSLHRSALGWLRAQGRSFMLGCLVYLLFAWLTKDFGWNHLYGIGGFLGRGLGDSGRFQLWRAAWDMIRSSPWLGVGPMHYGFHFFEVAAHPHNSVLQLASEYGLPATILGAALAACLLFYGLRWCRTAPSGADRDLNIALTASLLTGIAEAMLSGNTIMPRSQLLLCFCAGWLVGRNVPPRSPVRQNSGVINAPAPSGRIADTTGLLLHAALVLLILVSLGLQLRGARDYLQYRKNHGYEKTVYYHPRFWQDGHLPLPGAERASAKTP